MKKKGSPQIVQLLPVTTAVELFYMVRVLHRHQSLPLPHQPTNSPLRGFYFFEKSLLCRFLVMLGNRTVNPSKSLLMST